MIPKNRTQLRSTEAVKCYSYQIVLAQRTIDFTPIHMRMTTVNFDSQHNIAQH